MLAWGLWLAKSREKHVISKHGLVLHAANCWSPALAKLFVLTACMLLGTANDRNSTQISKGKAVFIGSLPGKDSLQVSQPSGTTGSRGLSFSLLCFPLCWPHFVDGLNIWLPAAVALGFGDTLLCIPNFHIYTHPIPRAFLRWNLNVLPSGARVYGPPF